MTDRAEVPLAEVGDRLELSVPADESAIELTHELVTRLWVRHEHVPDDLRMRFEMGLIEILANVVEHAFAVDGPPNPLSIAEGRRVLVTLAATPVSVRARLSDNGFPAQIDLSDIAMPDEESESGRGLAMALASLSDLAFTRDTGRNIWDLRCDLP